MDMTTEQIDREFQRQVRLCSGIGPKRMREIVDAQFGAQPAAVLQPVEIQRERLKVVGRIAEMLETQGVPLKIIPGETKQDRCARFARAFAAKIRREFGLEQEQGR